MFKDNFGRNLLKQPKIPLRIYTTSRTFENCTKITRCVKRTAIWHNFQCKSLIKRAKSQDFTHVFKRLDSLLENKHFYSGCSLYSCLQNQQYLLIVFPLVQPVAQLKCSKKHSVFFCECKSDIGNPPPLAYWTENGKNIGDFGYRAKVLTTDDITKGEPAMYSCNVKSHNLTDEKNIILGKRPYFTCVLLHAVLSGKMFWNTKSHLFQFCSYTIRILLSRFELIENSDMLFKKQKNSMFPYSYRNTSGSLGEREIEVGTTDRRASVSTLFRVLPNFH